MSYWIAGATVASAAIGAYGSNSASGKQMSAAEQAAQMRLAAAREGIDKQMPWYNAGTDALGQLQARMPQLMQSYDPQKLLNEPGYQFGMDQGQKSLESSLAARGLTDSGRALKAASRFGTDYSTTKLGDAFNRDRTSRMDTFGMLQGLSQGGQRSGESITNALVSAANGAASDKYAGANAGAAGDIAQAGQLGGLVNSLGGLMSTNSKSTPQDVNYSNEGRNYPVSTSQRYLADGGPVSALDQLQSPMRREPVVGTRGPMRTGGGGGLSKRAVLDALDVAWRDVPALPAPADSIATGAAALRNPRAVMQQREQQVGAYADGGAVCPWKMAAGGAVKGKTPGKSDVVPAKLAAGEHVIDAETVSMLGDGNNEAGQALLDELKQRVRTFKRSAPANQPAPALAGARNG